MAFIRREIDPNSFPKDPSKAVPGIFFHHIDLKDKFGWFPILQLADAGMIQSPDYIASWDPSFAESSPSIRDIGIDDLRSGTTNLGGVTPTAGDFVSRARDIRNGSLEVSAEEKAMILKRGDIELEFEKGRRRYAPEAASRLNCLYVLDNRRNIETMFGRKPHRLVVKVKIAEALRFTKADFRWYNAYWDNWTIEEHPSAETQNCIRNYWLSHPYKKGSSTWEYLVDGLIKLYDPRDIELVRKCKQDYFPGLD
ncbi:MAG: hypothetical protein A4E49_00145 [Methanosaeta sp. PtaU1.Bin112]|jgi:hypothetical protein|nr:MAG: hypothetical protein A4E49_00145 [Methanosaeta sp. PtaU1.Bin112]